MKFVIMGKLLCLFFLFSHNVYAQDSTEIPDITPKNMKLGVKYQIPYFELTAIKDFPKFLQHAIDSVNHYEVIFKMFRDSIISNGIKTRSEREFRKIRNFNKNIWLFTYTHRKPKVHEHFVIFTTKGDNVVKMTAGISEDPVDSFETIKRFKEINKIKFINLQSKIETHKF